MACPKCGSEEARPVSRSGLAPFRVRCRNCETVYELEATEDEPDIDTLQDWLDEAGCETITGYWVEPDGFGPDGSPSWLLVMGLI